MNISELDNKISSLLGYNLDHIPITVHTGSHDWEEIVDVVYCQECHQYHIISEKPHGSSSG